MSKLLGQSNNLVHIDKVQRAQAQLAAHIDSLMQDRGLAPPREDPVLVRDRVHRFHQLEATAQSPEGQGGS